MKTSQRAALWALLYLAVSALWIASSDQLLAMLVSDPVQLTRYQTWKGLVYVGLTALLCGWLLGRTASAEQRAIDTAAELDRMLEHAAIGIGQIDRAGRWRRVNRRLAELLGHSTDALLRHGMQGLRHPDDFAIDHALAGQLLRGETEQVHTQRRYLRADGSTVWVLVTMSLQRGAQPEQDLFTVAMEDINDLKAAEEALRASQSGLDQLVRAIPDIVWVKDNAGRYTRCNAAAVELFGHTEAEVIGRDDFVLFGAERAERYRAEDLRANRSGSALRVEEWQTDPHGRAVLLEITKIPLREVAGPLDGVLCVARDITERHSVTDRLARAERDGRALLAEAGQSHRALLGVIEDQQQAQEHLRASEERLRLALAGSGDGLWDWDLTTDLASHSEAFQRLLRYGGNDFRRDYRLRDRLHPGDRERTLHAVQRALDQGAPFDEDYRLQCFDGEWRWFHGRGTCHRSADGRPQRFSGILTDLTERRRADERLRLAAVVIDNTQEGVIITGPDQRIVSVNRAFTELLGYSEAEVLGQSPAMLKSGSHDADFYRALSQQLDRSGRWQGEIWSRRKNGEVFPEWLSISAVRDDAGALTHYVGVFTDISAIKTSEAELAYLAHHDSLTRLPNRVLFQTRLQRSLLEAERNGTHAAVLMLDLDRFKDVNDSYGHFAGDELLEQVARRLLARLPQADTLARLGGDEFALLLPGLDDPEDATRLARELISALTEPWHLSNGAEVVIGTSIGICLYPEHGTTPQALLQGADAALYRAKADGRGLYRYYSDELTAAARSRLNLETRLRRALGDGHLQLHYQPQYDIASGRLIGAEALLRWFDPEHGPIAPDRFIPVAEATGLIGEIGLWVLRQACTQGRRWLDAGLPALTLAVNVSPQQFRHGDLAEQVTTILQATGYPAQQLELELTESALMERETEVYGTLQSLRGLGVGLAIDDFGTGYSSLAYLKRFPLDVLKIDRGFIMDIPHDRDDMEIATAVIAMGHSLGLKVLAEGVETEAQLAFLRQKGCDSFQGFLKHKALPADEMEAVLRGSPVEQL
jgi:diguanylate cyclase (GGDEF)-like protein/PAS domain S-box-containing protein